MKKHHLWIASVAAPVLLLTACTSSEPTAPSQSDAATQSESQSRDEPTSDAEPPAESPFAVYFAGIQGLSDSNSGLDSEAIADENRRYEEAVTQCMSEAGIAYIPTDYQLPTDDTDTEAAGTVAYAQAHGYGLAESIQPAQPQDDTNAQRWEEMTEEEQKAYEDALWGSQDESGNLIPGCNDVAQQAVWGDAPADPLEVVRDNPEWSELVDQVLAVEDLMYSDPRAIQADKVWAKCMRSKGAGDFRSPDDAIGSLTSLHEAAYNLDTGEVDPAAVEKLRQAELALAVPDFQCREETGYNQLREQARFQFEQEFLDQHREQLDPMVAALRESQR